MPTKYCIGPGSTIAAFCANMKNVTHRGGKSVGTWEPSSQKFFKLAERNLRLKIISKMCVISMKSLTSLRRNSTRKILPILDTWLIYKNTDFFLQYVRKSYVFYAERNQPDNVVPRKCFDFFHLWDHRHLARAGLAQTGNLKFSSCFLFQRHFYEY
jgi:hypothetical protein